jgi:hypothetical protein
VIAIQLENGPAQTIGNPARISLHRTGKYTLEEEEVASEKDFRIGEVGHHITFGVRGSHVQQLNLSSADFHGRRLFQRNVRFAQDGLRVVEFGPERLLEPFLAIGGFECRSRQRGQFLDSVQRHACQGFATVCVGVDFDVLSEELISPAMVT